MKSWEVFKIGHEILPSGTEIYGPGVNLIPKIEVVDKTKVMEIIDLLFQTVNYYSTPVFIHPKYPQNTEGYIPVPEAPEVYVRDNVVANEALRKARRMLDEDK